MPARRFPDRTPPVTGLAVLVVDPDDGLADLIAAELRARHCVATATSAEGAHGIVDCGARFDVAVIACDLEEPRGGIQLARALARTSDRFVITLARSNVDDAMAAREVGDFVRKVATDFLERVVAAVEQVGGEGGPHKPSPPGR